MFFHLNDHLVLVNNVLIIVILGCYDGAVYERLFDLVKRFPLNQSDPNPAFLKYIKKIASSKL